MTHKFKPFMVFILCCSNSSRASPLKDNTRSRIVLIKKLTDAIQLSLTLKTTTAQVFRNVFRNVFRKVRHDVYFETFETFEVHMKTTYHPAKATQSKHQKLWAQCNGRFFITGTFRNDRSMTIVVFISRVFVPAD